MKTNMCKYDRVAGWKCVSLSGMSMWDGCKFFKKSHKSWCQFAGILKSNPNIRVCKNPVAIAATDPIADVLEEL